MKNEFEIRTLLPAELLLPLLAEFEALENENAKLKATLAQGATLFAEGKHEELVELITQFKRTDEEIALDAAKAERDAAQAKVDELSK